MIQKAKLLEAFNRAWTRKTPQNYFQNLRIFEELYLEARTLGVFPLKNPLEGIETDIRIARVLHVRNPS